MQVEAEDIITTKEADAVADRLLGQGPTQESDRVEQFFIKAAPTHGRGLGASQDGSTQGKQQLMPTSALAKSLKRGRAPGVSKQVEESRAAEHSGSKSAPQPSSSEGEEERPSRDQINFSNPTKGFTKQDLLAEHRAVRGTRKRKRKKPGIPRSQVELPK
eukprot:jgi/Ulvmu1/4873/UM020_0159.1